MKRTKPKVIELDTNELEEILERVEVNRATAEDHETIRTLSQSYVHLLELLKDKNTKIDRLRKLLFGASTEKTETVVGDKPDGSSASSSDNDDSESSEEDGSKEGSRPPPKGHGRNGADAYHGGEQIEVPHECLRPNDPCPECVEGTLYEQTKPGVLVRLVGQAPVGAKE